MNKIIKKILLTILLLLLFVITYLFFNHQISEFDNLIYNFIIKFKSDTLTSFFKIITNLGSVLTIVLICILILIFSKNKLVGINFSIFCIISSLINNIIKIIIKRPRPDILKLITQNGYSFPSGHSMVSLSLYGLLIYYTYKSNLKNIYKILLISMLFILIILIGISRIYLGVHYASDVICGYYISILLLNIYIFIEKRVKKV